MCKMDCNGKGKRACKKECKKNFNFKKCGKTGPLGRPNRRGKCPKADLKMCKRKCQGEGKRACKHECRKKFRETKRNLKLKLKMCKMDCNGKGKRACKKECKKNFNFKKCGKTGPLGRPNRRGKRK